jgi:tRNA (mo5U34)-methyltransferase
MATLREVRRKQNDFLEELATKGWYHSFELPDGTRVDGVMPIEWLRERWSRFPIPADLTGRRVLDIGPWDGWFSFEAERRGAQVTSIDREAIENYERMHRRLGSKADYRTLDLYELPAAGLGRFDIVFCLGVLYHLKHPVLGLEIVCAAATEVAIIETFVIEGDPEIPVMEFYETDELNGHMDNWVGPTVNCVLAMCRTAGFARVEVLGVDPTNVSLACWRKWEPEPESPAADPPELLAAVNPATFGINFVPTRDEYLACWFSSSAETLVREDLCLQVGEFGAPAVWVKKIEGGWQANFRLPPGTPQGWNQVRLRLKNSRFGNTLRIAVDVPVKTESIRVTGVRDAATWAKDATSGKLSCWVEGLPENADRHNVRLWLGEHRLRVLWVGEGDSRQVNAAIPEDCPAGEHELRVECGGASSAGVTVLVAQASRPA